VADPQRSRAVIYLQSKFGIRVGAVTVLSVLATFSGTLLLVTVCYDASELPLDIGVRAARALPEPV